MIQIMSSGFSLNFSKTMKRSYIKIWSKALLSLKRKSLSSCSKTSYNNFILFGVMVKLDGFHWVEMVGSTKIVVLYEL